MAAEHRKQGIGVGEKSLKSFLIFDWRLEEFLILYLRFAIGRIFDFRFLILDSFNRKSEIANQK
jgi:hypothetical protein